MILESVPSNSATRIKCSNCYLPPFPNYNKFILKGVVNLEKIDLQIENCKLKLQILYMQSEQVREELALLEEQKNKKEAPKKETRVEEFNKKVAEVR